MGDTRGRSDVLAARISRIRLDDEARLKAVQHDSASWIGAAQLACCSHRACRDQHVADGHQPRVQSRSRGAAGRTRNIYFTGFRAIQSPSAGAVTGPRSKISIEVRRLPVRVPLPPIGEQRRIADILDRADALCAMRREALALLDDLTQSIFLDMFGEPTTQRSRAGPCPEWPTS